MTLPTSKGNRKAIPLWRGLLAYFPDALAEVARVSKIGNDQHNPGEPMHWSREKSDDHADCILRHMTDDVTHPFDNDGALHLAKAAWRALALLQLRVEGLGAAPVKAAPVKVDIGRWIAALTAEYGEDRES